MNITVLYKSPKTAPKTVIDYLKMKQNDIVPCNVKFWLLGDFNVDFLVRDNVNTKKFVSYFRNIGLTQLISYVTRPNIYRGSCIDWIVTDSPFVQHSGVTNVLISDHLTVFCVCKKKRENNRMVYRTYRDFRNYSKENCVQLLKNSNWEFLSSLNDPNEQWELLRNKALEILSVMCPYKRYKQREEIKPWLTSEIYCEIRYREKCLNLFRITGNQYYFKLACTVRNRVNALVDQAKSSYFRNLLNTNAKKRK